jgi:hypothetical protein
MQANIVRVFNERNADRRRVALHRTSFDLLLQDSG